MKDKKREDHHDWSVKHEIHAEMNALLWAARN
jgi:dCMP deaminase